MAVKVILLNDHNLEFVNGAGLALQTPSGQTLPFPSGAEKAYLKDQTMPAIKDGRTEQSATKIIVI